MPFWAWSQVRRREYKEQGTPAQGLSLSWACTGKHWAANLVTGSLMWVYPLINYRLLTYLWLHLYSSIYTCILFSKKKEKNTNFCSSIHTRAKHYFFKRWTCPHKFYFPSTFFPPFVDNLCICEDCTVTSIEGNTALKIYPKILEQRKCSVICWEFYLIIQQTHTDSQNAVALGHLCDWKGGVNQNQCWWIHPRKFKQRWQVYWDIHISCS